jgi:hypothetical protein
LVDLGIFADDCEGCAHIAGLSHPGPLPLPIILGQSLGDKRVSIGLAMQTIDSE